MVRDVARENDLSNTQEGPVVEEHGLLHYSGHQPAGTYHALFDSLREQGPLVHTDGGGGYWMFTRHEDILRAAQNPRTFSNRSCIPIEPDPEYKWIPIMTDPPEHTKFRQVLLPRFAPSRVDELTPKVRQRCIEMLEPLVERGECEFVTDFARRYPTSIFMELMGLPFEDFETIMGWEDMILHGTPESDPDRAKAMQATMELAGYFAQLHGARKAEPRDDLMSYLLACTIDGEPMADSDWINVCLTLFLAGLDTVTAQLSYTFLHLATHSEHRKRVVADPSVIPGAVEESLRYYTILNTARRVTQDTEVHGCPLKMGEMVALPYAAANRDPAVFPKPQQFDVDRPNRNHIAFGAGPHRCLGSHLGRRELCVALEEWHQRIPDYRLADGAAVMEHGGPVLGLERLPLTWTPR